MKKLILAICLAAPICGCSQRPITVISQNEVVREWEDRPHRGFVNVDPIPGYTYGRMYKENGKYMVHFYRKEPAEAPTKPPLFTAWWSEPGHSMKVVAHFGREQMDN